MSGEQKHNTIVCGHCGKEYDEAFSYCPYCAEPKPEPRPQETRADAGGDDTVL